MNNSNEQNPIERALALISTLRQNTRPLELEKFIQDCSQDEAIIEGLIEAVQSQQLGDQQVEMLCMLIGKALAAENLSEERQFKFFLRLVLNWSIPDKAKQMLEGDFKKFIQYVSDENMDYFHLIIGSLQHLIDQIAIERKAEIYESAYIQIDDFRVSIVVRFPQQFVPMTQTYIFLIKNVLLFQSDVQKMLEVTNNFYQLKTLHSLMFQAQNIVFYPELFLSLFQFYLELDEVQSLSKDPPEKRILQSFDFLAGNLTMVYQALCEPCEEGATNYLNIATHDKAESVLKLKSKVSQFHIFMLTQLMKKENALFEQLIHLYPSILLTVKSFLEEKDNRSKQEEYFTKNMLVLMAINIQKVSYTPQHILQLFKDLIVPFLEYTVDATEKSGQKGQELYFLLEDCTEYQASQHLLSETILVFQNMFKNTQLLKQLYFYAGWSLRNRFNPTDCTSQQIQNLPKPMQASTVFLLLAIISSKGWNPDQDYLSICKDLGKLIDRQFLENLTTGELTYFYYFLQYNLDYVCSLFPENYEILFEFALTSGQTDLEYFALGLIKVLLQDTSNEQSILSYVMHMKNFRNQESINLKWEIFHIIINEKMYAMETNNIVLLIFQITAEAKRELERMRNQKKSRIAVYYGQAKYYMGSLRYIKKRLKQKIMRRPILEALLQFLGLIDFAGQVHVEVELVKLATEILPLYQSIPELSYNGVIILQKLLIVLIQNNYDGQLLLTAVFSFLNTFHEEQEANSFYILRTLQHGCQFLGKNLEKPNFNYYDRSLANLLTLFQKYLITFGIRDLNQAKILQFFQKISLVAQNFLEKYSGSSQSQSQIKIVATKYKVLQIIFSIANGYDLNCQELMYHAHQNWFLNYNAFLLLRGFDSVITTLTPQNMKLLLQVGIQMLANQDLELIRQSKSKQIQKQTLRIPSRTKDPLDQLHIHIDYKFYKPNIAEQVWSLFQNCNIHSWKDCQKAFPSFNQSYFQFLEFCRERPSLKSQQNLQDYIDQKTKRISKINKEFQLQIKMMSKQLTKQENKPDIKASRRKILKVTGDRASLNERTSIYNSNNFKRDNSRQFLQNSCATQQNDQDEDEYYRYEDFQFESQSHLPTKKIIDNYFLQHRSVKVKTQISSFQSDKSKKTTKNRRQQMKTVLATSDLGRLILV